jgi:hypothetical protein
MEALKTIKVPDMNMEHFLYTFDLYDMEFSDITPLTEDQLEVKMNGEKNSIEIITHGLQLKIKGKSYARAGLIWAHGSALIAVNTRNFNFKVSPRLHKDGKANSLDYHVEDLVMDVRPGDIILEKVSFSIFPDFVVRIFAQMIVDTLLVFFTVF